MSKERAWTRQSLMAGAAVILVLVTGLVHLVETPANYAEAAYKGILFFLNAVGGLILTFRESICAYIEIINKLV